MPSKQLKGLVRGAVAGWQCGAYRAVILSILAVMTQCHQLQKKRHNSSLVVQTKSGLAPTIASVDLI